MEPSAKYIIQVSKSKIKNLLNKNHWKIYMIDKNGIKQKIKQVIETYNKIANLYAKRKEDKLLQFQLNTFISLLPKKAKVLEAGCGPGRDAAYLQEDGLDIIGIDISNGMLKEAKKKKIKVKKMDMLNLKFEDKLFDGIWCMASLSDIQKKDAQTALKEFYRVLKDPGVIYIAVKEGEGEEIVEKEEYNKMPRFYAYYKQAELEDLLKFNGFKIVKATTSNDQGILWVEIFAKKVYNEANQ